MMSCSTRRRTDTNCVARPIGRLRKAVCVVLAAACFRHRLGKAAEAEIVIFKAAMENTHTHTSDDQPDVVFQNVRPRKEEATARSVEQTVGGRADVVVIQLDQDAPRKTGHPQGSAVEATPLGGYRRPDVGTRHLAGDARDLV